MSLLNEFSEIVQELSQFQTTIDRARVGMKRPREREKMGELLERVQQARTQAENAVPAAIDRIRQVAEDLQKRAEEHHRNLDELAKRIELRKNQAQPPAAG